MESQDHRASRITTREVNKPKVTQRDLAAETKEKLKLVTETTVDFIRKSHVVRSACYKSLARNIKKFPLDNQDPDAAYLPYLG